jgi:hypothetical protein
MPYLLDYKKWNKLFEQDDKVAQTQQKPTEEPTVTSTAMYGGNFSIEGFVQPDNSKFPNAGEWNKAFEEAYFNYLGTDLNKWLGKTILVFKSSATKLGYSPNLLQGSFKLMAFYKGYDCYPSAQGNPGNLKYGMCQTNPTLYLFKEQPLTGWTGDIKTTKYKSNTEFDIDVRNISLGAGKAQSATGSSATWSNNPGENLLVDQVSSESLKKYIAVPLASGTQDDGLKLYGAYGKNVIVPDAIYNTLGKVQAGTLIGENVKRN